MKKVLTFGVFDYFHIGHLRLFENCKKYGDYLIVAIQDGEFIKKYKPDAQILYSTQDRYDMVRALRVVDNVVIYDEVVPKTLEKIDFDILALGEDHISKRFQVVVKWCEEHGKMVIRMKRTPSICSSDIKNKFT